MAILGRKARYNDEELEEFKILILSKLEKSKHDLQYVREQIIEINDSEDKARFGDFEEGSQSSEVEYLAQMAARQQQFIKHLEYALIRIKNRTYGICSVTGELIEKARLMAVPHATKSVQAKNLEVKVDKD